MIVVTVMTYSVKPVTESVAATVLSNLPVILGAVGALISLWVIYKLLSMAMREGARW